MSTPNCNISYIFPGAPIFTTYQVTINYAFCSGSTTFKCNDTDSKFEWNDYKHKLIVSDSTVLKSKFNNILSRTITLKNASKQFICEIFPRYAGLKHKYIAQFQHHFYSIDYSTRHMIIYYGNPKQGGFEVATFDVKLRGGDKTFRVIQNVDPGMMIAIAMSVLRIRSRQQAN
eukprot:NODE_127_length_17034_cov_0.369590.p11 type:complete len:173 gc:universal NODE_127_length_17034_cov_0.369590:5721-6239(+)